MLAMCTVSVEVQQGVIDCVTSGTIACWTVSDVEEEETRHRVSHLPIRQSFQKVNMQ
jgi:hypothetical protein